MMLAHMAGIKVFGTGGLGGVHRGGELSMDISGAYDGNKSVSWLTKIQRISRNWDGLP